MVWSWLFGRKADRPSPAPAPRDVYQGLRDLVLTLDASVVGGERVHSQSEA